MAEQSRDGNSGGGGLLDLEKELTCSICTDILYQPLTLLDCLHTFCGSCSKEWFAWQATAAKNNRRTGNPYTCPSCRESVRGTKADWRLTALLEGFLKASPERGKTGEEKEEMRHQYKPGEDILPPVRIEREEDDSEDERLLAEVRELSMANVDPETARRRAERSARERQRRRQEQRSSPRTSHRPEELGRQHQSSRWVAQQAERQRDSDDRQVEHQPSLRSLLSDSQITSEDVQEEILQSIYSEGLLTGIDIDNLTTQQEEELTERIADAYRRRQRNRERSRNRERPAHEREAVDSHSPRPAGTQSDSSASNQTRAELVPPQQSHAPRSRPPISRPHLFEQSTSGAERNDRRSASSTSHRRRQSGNENIPSGVTSAARSATDLSLAPDLRDQQQRPRALSSNARSTTDPANMHNDVRRVRNTSNSLRPGSSEGSVVANGRAREPRRRDTASTAVGIATDANSNDPATQSVRPVVSTSAFAPEPVTSGTTGTPFPSISCSRCERANIGDSLHYNCGVCRDGDYNLCLQCYRASRGCDHWFGFGYNAWEKWSRTPPPSQGWPRGFDRPHVLTARRYKSTAGSQEATGGGQNAKIDLEEGAFCESCFNNANSGYWYCQYCLDGAWGFCDDCVHQGKHCTHPLLPVAHLSAISNASHDPSKLNFLPLPHLKQHSFILRPDLTVYCDICSTAIPPKDSRFHCYQCSHGDYDVCNPCYHKLVANGKISQANGHNGWRRCLQGHRMAVVGYQVIQHGGSHNRVTYQGPVGGWRLKDEETRAPPPPNINETGLKYYAIWNRFPDENVTDELSFPRNAVICEVDDRNEDWAHGVYAGRVGLFPKNHTTRN